MHLQFRCNISHRQRLTVKSGYQVLKWPPTRTGLGMHDGLLMVSRLWAVEPRLRLIIVQMGLIIRNDCAESLESEVNCQAVCSR